MLTLQRACTVGNVLTGLTLVLAPVGHQAVSTQHLKGCWQPREMYLCCLNVVSLGNNRVEVREHRPYSRGYTDMLRTVDMDQGHWLALNPWC